MVLGQYAISTFYQYLVKSMILFVGPIDIFCTLADQCKSDVGTNDNFGHRPINVNVVLGQYTINTVYHHSVKSRILFVGPIYIFCTLAD